MFFFFCFSFYCFIFYSFTVLFWLFFFSLFYFLVFLFLLFYCLQFHCFIFTVLLFIVLLFSFYCFSFYWFYVLLFYFLLFYVLILIWCLISKSHYPILCTRYSPLECQNPHRDRSAQILKSSQIVICKLLRNLPDRSRCGLWHSRGCLYLTKSGVTTSVYRDRYKLTALQNYKIRC